MLIVSPSADEHQQRADDGQWNRDRDDEGRTPTAEEDEDHDCGQAAGDDGLALHPADGRFDEDRLVGDGPDLERGGQLRRNQRQPRAHIGDDVQRGCVARLQKGDERGPLPVDAHNVGLRRKAVAHIADVVDVDRRAVYSLDRQVVERRNRLRRAVGLDLIVDLAHLHIAGGQDDVLRAHRVHHVGSGEAIGLQLLGVDVHLHLALLAAVWEGHGGALHRGQLGANEVRAKVVQLLLCEAVAGESQLQHGNAGCAVLNDERRRRARGITAQRRLCDRRDLRHGLRDVDIGVEVDLDDGDAVQRLRLRVLDVIDRGGQAALEGHHNPVAQLLRREARIVPDDGDNRDVDVGEDVDRGALDHHRAEEEEQQRQHDECVGSPKCETDDPHQNSFGREPGQHRPRGTRPNSSVAGQANDSFSERMLRNNRCLIKR